MTNFALSKVGISRASDRRRAVSVAETGYTRQTGYDAAVVFGSIGLIILLTLVLIGAPLSSLLVVAFGFFALIALAAREYLADLAAGVVLHVAQPVRVGETVHIYSEDARDHVDAMVAKLGFVHTSLTTGTGLLVVPNHRLFVNARED